MERENKVSRLDRARSREKAGEVCRLEAPAGCWSSGVERLGREGKHQRLQSTPAAAGANSTGPMGEQSVRTIGSRTEFEVDRMSVVVQNPSILSVLDQGNRAITNTGKCMYGM